MPPSQKKKSIKKSQIIHSHHPLTAITIITNKNLTQNNHKNYSKAPPPWGACRCCCGDPAVAVVGKLAAGCGSLLPPRPWRARRRGHGSPPSPLLLDLAEGRRRSPLLPPLPPNLAEGRARPSPPMLPPVAAAAAPSPPAAATRRPLPPLLRRRLPPRLRERGERERRPRGGGRRQPGGGRRARGRGSSALVRGEGRASLVATAVERTPRKRKMKGGERG